MPIRITGMNSGLDTESIISELVKAQKSKVESVKKKQTSFEWKQDAWKKLNSKIYKLFNNTLNNMRFSGDYSKKTTDVSDSSVASVVTGDGAMNIAQKLEVISLSSNAYMTSGELDSTVGNNTKLTDLKDGSGNAIAEGSVINLTVGDKTTEITVTADMTVNQFVAKLQKAGVEASFDSKNKRFHMAAKQAGAANDFSFDVTGSDATALAALKLTDAAGAKKTDGEDAKIKLNGIEYTSNSNTFEINGLTITALAKTTGEVTLNTRRDTDDIYNKIKNFFKEYNSLINEMDKLYNAESSKGYEPLTDEEKDAMSDTEIEKWETKIKDSVLRRDSNLSTISSAMKNIMMQGATVNGKQMYLSNFGIETLGYWSSEENEKNAYHINGDEDDSAVSAQENKLKAMVASDPDTVISFFSELSTKLYKELDRQSRPIEGVRSFGSFYDDKKMKEDYNNFSVKIQEQEEKLTAMEDRWYKKFSAMETALAKLQSNQSAVSGLLGLGG